MFSELQSSVCKEQSEGVGWVLGADREMYVELVRLRSIHQTHSAAGTLPHTEQIARWFSFLAR